VFVSTKYCHEPRCRVEQKRAERERERVQGQRSLLLKKSGIHMLPNTYLAEATKRIEQESI